MKANKNVQYGVIALCMLGIVIMAFNPTNDESSSTASSTISSDKSAKETIAVPSTQCSVTPERVYRAPAPDSNELVMAARILKEAADPETAALNIQLAKAHDLSKTRANIWKLRAETEKSKAQYHQALQEQKDITNGTLEYVQDDVTSKRARNRILGGEEDLTTEVVGTTLEKIELRGYDDVTGTMLLKVGKSWKEDVVVGQYISAHQQVKSFDANLYCMEISQTNESGKSQLITTCLN
ncbi:TPA: hypothetical protein I7682_17705 [Vibrio vulnificus]|nr:hypothetical protein [Vibrio vulnificus]